MAKKQHKNVRLSDVQDSLDEEKEINAGQSDDDQIDHDDFVESDRIDDQREINECCAREVPFDFDIRDPFPESVQEYNQRITDDQHGHDFNDDDRVENYGLLLGPLDIYEPPRPPSWESIFDNANKSQNGQTLSDLLKDMNAIEQPSRFVQEILTMDTSDLKDKTTIVKFSKERDRDLMPERDITWNPTLTIFQKEGVTINPNSLGALLIGKFNADQDPITLRERSMRKQELVPLVLSKVYTSNCSRITDAKKDKF